MSEVWLHGFAPEAQTATDPAGDPDPGVPPKFVPYKVMYAPAFPGRGVGEVHGAADGTSTHTARILGVASLITGAEESVDGSVDVDPLSNVHCRDLLPGAAEKSATTLRSNEPNVSGSYLLGLTISSTWTEELIIQETT